MLSLRVFHTNVTVNITTTDLNDQHPPFNSTYIDIYVPQSSTVGNAVYIAIAVNQDFDEAGEVTGWKSRRGVHLRYHWNSIHQ